MTKGKKFDEHEIESHRDEIERIVRQSMLRKGVNLREIDSSTFTKKDLGIERLEHVYCGRDKGGVTSEDIQKILDRAAPPQRERKEREAVDFLKHIKLGIAKTRLWLMKNKILPKVEHFNVPPWMSHMVPEYLDFINPGGIVFYDEGTFEITTPLAPNDNTTITGCNGATLLEVQSDIDCINIEGTSNDLKEHIVVEKLSIAPKNGVTSTNAGIRLKYAGDIRLQQLAINEMKYGIEAPQTNTVTQCKFDKIHSFECGYGVSAYSTYDCRWRDLLINSPQKTRASGGKAFALVNGMGGDVFDGVMALQGLGKGFYFSNCEWLMIANCIADDCSGAGWTFTGSGMKGLQMMNCWGSSCGMNLGGQGGAWSGANGFVFENIEDWCQLVNLQARGNASSGIVFSNCDGLSLINPIVASNSKSNQDKHGIDIWNSQHIQVIGGKSTDTETTKTQCYGVFEGEGGGTTDNNLIAFIDLLGNKTGTLNKIGTNTITWRCEGAEAMDGYTNSSVPVWVGNPPVMVSMNIKNGVVTNIS